MNIKFQTDKYPELKMDISVKPKILGLNIELSIDDEVITPSDAKRQKYIISKNGTSYDVQITNTPYDSKVIISGEKFELMPKIPWYNYVIGGLPFVLVLNGGGLGGVFGFLGWTINMNFLRFGEGLKKYLYVLGSTVATSLAFLICVGIIGFFFQ